LDDTIGTETRVTGCGNGKPRSGGNDFFGDRKYGVNNFGAGTNFQHGIRCVVGHGLGQFRVDASSCGGTC
jgi:hypothetical protein